MTQYPSSMGGSRPQMRSPGVNAAAAVKKWTQLLLALLTSPLGGKEESCSLKSICLLVLALEDIKYNGCFLHWSSMYLRKTKAKTKEQITSLKRFHLQASI